MQKCIKLLSVLKKTSYFSWKCKKHKTVLYYRVVNPKNIKVNEKIQGRDTHFKYKTKIGSSTFGQDGIIIHCCLKTKANKN